MPGIPRWLLVNVDSSLMVTNPDNDGFLESILDDILGILGFRETEHVELGLQMLNTCQIIQIRPGSNDSREFTVIEFLPGPNVEWHEITVTETISEICAALDCADATARPQTKKANANQQRIQTDVKREVVALRDRSVLVALYEATSGANWTNNDKWMTTDPISEWHGVHSFPATPGSLTNLSALMLGGNKLAGSIPAELGKLTNLRGLNLGGNELTGPIPAELGSLTNLIALVLYGNKLAGSIPIELGNLENLTILDLRNNELTGPIPAELGSLTNLSALVLGHNKLAGPIPAGLGNLENLTQLDLGANDLTGAIPVELENLKNLTDLGIDTDTGLCLAKGFPLTSKFATLAQGRGLLVCSDDAGAGPRPFEASASVVGSGELRPVFRSRFWHRLDPVS